MRRMSRRDFGKRERDAEMDGAVGKWKLTCPLSLSLSLSLFLSLC